MKAISFLLVIQAAGLFAAPSPGLGLPTNVFGDGHSSETKQLKKYGSHGGPPSLEGVLTTDLEGEFSSANKVGDAVKSASKGDLHGAVYNAVDAGGTNVRHGSEANKEFGDLLGGKKSTLGGVSYTQANLENDLSNTLTGKKVSGAGEEKDTTKQNDSDDDSAHKNDGSDDGDKANSGHSASQTDDDSSEDVKDDVGSHSVRKSDDDDSADNKDDGRRKKEARSEDDDCEGASDEASGTGKEAIGGSVLGGATGANEKKSYSQDGDDC